MFFIVNKNDVNYDWWIAEHALKALKFSYPTLFFFPVSKLMVGSVQLSICPGPLTWTVYSAYAIRLLIWVIFNLLNPVIYKHKTWVFTFGFILCCIWSLTVVISFLLFLITRLAQNAENKGRRKKANIRCLPNHFCRFVQKTPRMSVNSASKYLYFWWQLHEVIPTLLSHLTCWSETGGGCSIWRLDQITEPTKLGVVEELGS